MLEERRATSEHERGLLQRTLGEERELRQEREQVVQGLQLESQARAGRIEVLEAELAERSRSQARAHADAQEAQRAGAAREAQQLAGLAGAQAALEEGRHALARTQAQLEGRTQELVLLRTQLQEQAVREEEARARAAAAAQREEQHGQRLLQLEAANARLLSQVEQLTTALAERLQTMARPVEPGTSGPGTV